MKRWTIEQLKNSVSKCYSYRQVIKDLGLIPAGGNYVHVKKYISENNIDIQHFKGKTWNKGMRGGYNPKLPIRDLLVKNSEVQSFKLKKRLFIEGIKKQECENCGWSKRSLDGRLPLELDHINGDRMDNRLENLRILCPNCHSLCDTHRGRNKKSRDGEIGRRATLKML